MRSFKTVISMPNNERVTVLLVDFPEFWAIVESLSMDEQERVKCKYFRYIRSVVRGADTEWIFVKFGISTGVCQVSVIGDGPTLLAKLDAVRFELN